MTTPTATHSADTAVKHFIDPEQLRRDLQINKFDIGSPLSNQAALYFHYAELSVKARLQLDRLKARYNLTVASLNRAYRKALKDENPDPKAKITEAQIESAVQLDPQVARLAVAIVEAESVFRISEAAVFSFVQRKDMLVQLARNESHPGNNSRASNSAAHQDIAQQRQQMFQQGGAQ